MSQAIGTLTDAGPLFALADPSGQPKQFARCRQALAEAALPLVTTWPCLAEALHLAKRRGGWSMQEVITDMVGSEQLVLHAPNPSEAKRIIALMTQYRDRPMDLADASLVALADAVGYDSIFSIDSDFYIYRLAGGGSLRVFPGPLPRGL